MKAFSIITLILTLFSLLLNIVLVNFLIMINNNPWDPVAGSILVFNTLIQLAFIITCVTIFFKKRAQ